MAALAHTKEVNLMHSVLSKDGTTIAFDRLGDGPPIVLVAGAAVDRQANANLASALAADFTVFNYDRRGRGESGDTLPYAVEREVEDLAAVIDAAGGSALVLGTSSGAALALEATASGLPITGLAMWEAPYAADPAARPPADIVEQYDRMIAEGRRDDAVEYFASKVIGLPPVFVGYLRTQPQWAASVAIANTLAYDARVMGDSSLPLDRAAIVTVPTLVLAGGASYPFMRETAEALAAVLPNGRSLVLEGQEHNVDPVVLGAALREFFIAEIGVRS